MQNQTVKKTKTNLKLLKYFKSFDIASKRSLIFKLDRERQKDRETKRQRDRETERQRDRETERQRDRKR